jgi:hypothetical protein
LFQLFIIGKSKETPSSLNVLRIFQVWRSFKLAEMKSSFYLFKNAFWWKWHRIWKPIKLFWRTFGCQVGNIQAFLFIVL